MQFRKMTELEQRMSDDFDWALHAPEVYQNSEYFGKLVVVYNKRVLCAGTDRRALVEQAAKEAGVPRQRLTVLVVPSPEIWEVPD